MWLLLRRWWGWRVCQLLVNEWNGLGCFREFGGGEGGGGVVVGLGGGGGGDCVGVLG